MIGWGVGLESYRYIELICGGAKLHVAGQKLWLNDAEYEVRTGYTECGVH